MNEKVIVTIYSFNEDNAIDVHTKELKPPFKNGTRYVNTFKPKRGYKVEKVLIEEVETLV